MSEGKKSEVTNAGSVEINESDLDQISGGPAYVKFEDIKGEVTAKTAVKSGYDLATRKKV